VDPCGERGSCECARSQARSGRLESRSGSAKGNNFFLLVRHHPGPRQKPRSRSTFPAPSSSSVWKAPLQSVLDAYVNAAPLLFFGPFSVPLIFVLKLSDADLADDGKVDLPRRKRFALRLRGIPLLLQNISLRLSGLTPVHLDLYLIVLHNRHHVVGILRAFAMDRPRPGCFCLGASDSPSCTLW